MIGAFLGGLFLGAILGVLIMCILIGAKKSKSGGGYFLSDDDLGEG